MSNIYKVSQTIQSSIGMGLINCKCVLPTRKGIVQMGLLLDRPN